MANSPAPVPDFSKKWTKTLPAGQTANASTLGLVDGDTLQVLGKLVWDITSNPPNLFAIDFSSGTADFESAPGNKVINVGTLWAEKGTLLIGDCNSNTPLNGSLTVNFLDIANDPVWDPAHFAGGLVMMGGTVNWCGAAAKSSKVRCKGVAHGSSQITLLETPVGWNAGDTILTPATYFNPTAPEDDVIPMALLSGMTLTLSKPLAFDHSTPILDFSNKSTQEVRGGLTYQKTETYTLSFDPVAIAVTVTCVQTWKELSTGQGGTFTQTRTYNDYWMPTPTTITPCLYVGNLTRAITFQSVNPAGNRGHCMFMKDMDGGVPKISRCHYTMKDMGRTRADIPVTDPMVDENGVLVPGTADNPRARYSDHLHRLGQLGADGTTASALQTSDGAVIWGFLKIGHDNHDSNEVCTNGIAFDGQGSGFFTERGTEIGEYAGCWAHKVLGYDGHPHSNITNDESLISRLDVDDFGSQGFGFWANGAGVEFTKNVASCCMSGGLFVFQGGPQTTPPYGVIATSVLFDTLSAQQQAILSQPLGGGFGPYGKGSQVPQNVVPQAGISGNVLFAHGDVAETMWAIDNQPNGSVFDGTSVWNCTGATMNQYANSIVFQNHICIGPYVPGSKVNGTSDTTKPGKGWVGCNANAAYGKWQSYNYMTVIGYDVGIVDTFNNNLHTDGYFANNVDFYIDVLMSSINPAQPETEGPTNHLWSGQPIFAQLQQPLPVGQKRLNFSYEDINPLYNYDFSQWVDLNALWHRFDNTLPGNWQLYFPEQLATAIAFPQGGSYFVGFPMQLVGATQAQIQAAYGVGLQGGTVTAPAFCPWTSDGIIGPAQPLAAGQTVWTRPLWVVTNVAATTPSSPTNYVPTVYDCVNDPSQQHVVTYPAMNLSPGYNLLALTPNGVPSVIPVWGGIPSGLSVPVVTTQPTSQTVTAGQTATFTASASGDPTPTVQWQISTNQGQSWSAIQGATSGTLTVSSVTAAMNGTQYRAVFTNSQGSAASNAATLTVQSASQPIAVSGMIGNKQYRPVSFGVSLMAADQSFINQGSVTFSVMQGQMIVHTETVTVSVGQAWTATITLPVGSYTVMASYSDPANKYAAFATTATNVVN